MSGGLFAFATWGLRDDVVHPEMKGVKDDEELFMRFDIYSRAVLDCIVD